MIEVLESIISLVITLGILVTIHEYGHFWVARRCGVKVLKFSVGFGRSIWSWTDKQGTEFSIASIPLGGYVKMLDEREAPVPAELKSQAFNCKPVSQRIAIASAGPIANFLFAIFAYWLMFLSGFNVLIPSVGGVVADSPAHKAGMDSGVEIVSVDGIDTPGWRDVNMALVNRIGDTGEIVLSVKQSGDSYHRRYSLKVENWLAGVEQKDFVAELGIEQERPHIPAKIAQVLPDSAAENGGVKQGDIILSVDGESIVDWFDFVAWIKKSAGTALVVEVARENTSSLNLKLIPSEHINEQGEVVGRLGVAPEPFKFPEEMIRTVRYGPLSSLSHAASQTWADTSMTVIAIKKMLIGLISLENLSGPITIAKVASASISSGFEDFLRFLALLSVSLGVLNLLPIPVLDGGHILYYTLEAIRGKPIPEQWQLIGLKVGVSFILMLMTLAFYNDLMRL